MAEGGRCIKLKADRRKGLGKGYQIRVGHPGSGQGSADLEGGPFGGAVEAQIDMGDL